MIPARARGHGLGSWFALAPCVLALVTWSDVQSENIDPGEMGNRYSWGENVGWINAEPLGNDGPGVHVHDFELSGWMWGENIGWISLTCKNEEQGGPSCERVDYGVKHNGAGMLSGFAWAENVGWIDFAPHSAGVFIDVGTGDFSGHAWGENIGWISFRSNGPNPFVLTTAWVCEPPPEPPIGFPSLRVGKEDTLAILTWTPNPGATGFDVVYGVLEILRDPGGGFVPSTTGCIGENLTGDVAAHPELPPPNEGFWYLVRGVNCGTPGTYDTDEPSQASPRDDDIEASGDNCIVP